MGSTHPLHAVCKCVKQACPSLQRDFYSVKPSVWVLGVNTKCVLGVNVKCVETRKRVSIKVWHAGYMVFDAPARLLKKRKHN